MAQLNDIQQYANEWTRTMVLIWKEKIERLRIVRSGHLHESFSQKIAHSEAGTSISMKFAAYGIYQALGVGKGYARGNGGDLQFLDPSYREAHGLNKKRRVGRGAGGYLTSGRPRKRRDWIEKKYYMSRMALKEDVARITGEQAAMVVCNALTDIRQTLS